MKLTKPSGKCHPGRLVAIAAFLVMASHTSASDWPAFRHDARRSAVSADRLQFPMQRVWQHESRMSPRPAFSDPLKHPTNADFAFIRDHSEPVLLDFDHAFHPVAAQGRVFFGSSADDSVRCLSLQTGEPLWSFVTGGPVRFAPHVVGNRVYVGSDDGFVYCLNADDGKPVWTFRAAPSARQLVGNGRMISRWPLRTGVLVLDGVVYVTAGMWPAEGVFVYALDAGTGKVQWVNDTSGTLNLRTANPGAYAISGVAPTGYLLASDNALVVATGRSIPASYSRKDGRLLASVAPSYQNRRGGPPVCIDRHGSVIYGYPRERLTTTTYALHYAYRLPNMVPFGTMRADRVLADDRTFVTVNDMLRCYDANSRYTKVKVDWEQPCPSRNLRCLSLSANALLTGIDDRLVARDRATGELLWEQAGLDGYVQSIAVVDERILVATDHGSIYCFAANGTEARTRPGTDGTDHSTKSSTTKAEEVPSVLRGNRIRRGLALVIGDRNTARAAEIAAASQLQVVLLLDGADAVQRARNQLLDSNVPGQGQVSVQPHVAGAALPFADYSFNLIAATGKMAVAQTSELFRVLRPAGGELHVTDAGSSVAGRIESAVKNIAAADQNAASAESSVTPRATSPDGLTQTERFASIGTFRRAENTIVFRRGKLPGALDWDSENRLDQRVKWPLELLWFGGPGSKRTGGGSRAPIAAGGRNFVLGKNHLMAVDAYNGTELWSRTLPYLYRNIGRLRNAPGPIRPWLTASINADDDHVWLNFGHVVYTLDAATGEQLAVHGKLPDAPVLALEAKGLRIELDHYQQPDARGVNSQPTKAATPAGNIHTQLDPNGQLKLTLELQAEVVIDARLYWELFLDVRPKGKRANLYESGVFHLLAWPASGQVQTGIGPVHPRVSVSVEEQGRRLVLSLPMAELERMRGGPMDDFHLAAALNQPARPDQKAMSAGRGYLRWEFHADAFATAFNNGWPRIVVNPNSDPSSSNPLRGKSLPAITDLPELALKSARIGGIGPKAGYVVTLKGQRKNPLSLEVCEFDFNRGKGCGRLVSSGALQVLRSGTLAFYDHEDDSGMRYFGGIRPSCTISAIPAQGLVFAAEGSSGCSCNYNFKTTLALAPAKQRRHEDWAMFTAPLTAGAQLQTGRFNFGAPGDRRDAAGNLWLQYPRAPTYSSRILPHAARTMPVPVELFGDRPQTYRVNADRVAIADTDRPWLFASGFNGIAGVRLQLFMTDQEGIVVFHGEAPKLDAVLEPESWERRYSISAGTDSSMFLSHDQAALYVGYEVVPRLDRRGKRMPWSTRHEDRLPFSASFGAQTASDDTSVWEEDSLEFLISDRSLKTILHLGIGITGGRYDGVWSKTAKQEDPAVSLKWSGAVNVTVDKAVAEFAIPWQTLKAAGLDTNNLVIRARTKKPLTTQPHISHGFRPVITKSGQPQEKSYRVTLHFAELQDIKVGDRVFDVEVQGKTVVSAFDVMAVAGRRNRAVSRTFRNVAADRVLDVRLVQRGSDKGLPPILSAIEVVLDN